MPELEEKASVFASAALAADADVLVVPGWGKREWAALFACATQVTLRSGATLIQQREPDRTLYFLTAGVLEAALSFNDHALAPLRLMYPGSVVGEVAFFDGKPRSARVWAVEDSELLKLEFPAYARFAAAHVELANQLLFALGRLLALRLRTSTARATFHG